MTASDVSLKQWHEDEEVWWDKYGRYMTYQWQLTPALNRVLRSDLEADYYRFLHHPGEKLLDLGCGSGWLASHFAEGGMRVLGVDFSQEQIDLANALRVDKQLETLSFECCDLLSWDAEKHKGAFSNVFVNAFMHHLPESELKLILDKIATVLKPGGRVFLYEPLRALSAVRRPGTRIVDAICNRFMYLFLNAVPRWFGLFDDRYKHELKNGYQMNSPHEGPIDVEVLKAHCAGAFEILEVKGRHLNSLGFAMQVMTLREWVRPLYACLVPVWFWIDQILLRDDRWMAFSQPKRFILCSVKLSRK